MSDPQSTVRKVPVEPLSAEDERQLRAAMAAGDRWPTTMAATILPGLLATLDAARAPQPVTATELEEAMSQSTFQHGGGDWNHATWCRVEMRAKGPCDCGLDPFRSALAALPVREDEPTEIDRCDVCASFGHAECDTCEACIKARLTREASHVR